MKTMTRFLAALALVALVATGAFAQTNAMTHTVLSSAIANTGNPVTFNVSSATGFTAGSTMACIDFECFNITGVTSTRITAQRGFQATTASPHASGAIVLVGPYSSFYNQDPPGGSCTAAAQAVLPYVNVQGKRVWNCNAGQWVLQTWPDSIPNGPTKYCTVEGGTSGIAYGSAGTAVTLVDGTIYIGSFELPKTTRITSMTALQAGTVGTNALIFILYRADGVKLATTSLSGTTTAGANTFLSANLTTPYLATGPARYYFGLQGNGTTDNVRLVAASTFIDLFGNSQTGTFATVPNFTTVPTALTADKAPFGCVVATTP